jgi:hypothetical protein
LNIDKGFNAGGQMMLALDLSWIPAQKVIQFIHSVWAE